MISGALFALVLAATLGGALATGALFAFSAWVMRSLAALPPAEGIAAMRSINRFAPTPVFMSALFGSALLYAVAVVWALIAGGDDQEGLLIAAAAVYVAGPAGVTMALNVPLNLELDGVDAASPEGVAFWERYLREWTRWNTLRVGLGVVATGLAIGALAAG